MYAAFKEAKAKEIEVLLRRQKCGTLLPKQLKRPDFRAALQKKSVSIIAEFKQASPSLGVIRSDLMVEDCARIYEEHGAAAMSILTEERFFQGSISFLERAAKVCGLALLRKDFLFEEVQVLATAETSAQAFLLIVGLLDDVAKLRRLRELGEEYGLCAVVEVNNAEELRDARKSGAKIIQVNARNLQTLDVDCRLPLELIKQYPPRDGEMWICASGIKAADQILAAKEAGYQACLVGTTLMQSNDIGLALDRLLEGQC